MPPNTVTSPLTNGALDHEIDKVTPMETIMPKKVRWNEFETDLKWGNVIFMAILHIVGIYSFITFPYREQFFLVVWGYLVAEFTGIGISAGVHRLWTHRTYKAKVPLRIFLAIAYYTAGMYSINAWVKDHRVHHKYTDTDADPHNSNRGLLFSHCGWLMMKKKPIVRERAKGIDMTDILEDPVVQFFDRNFTLLNTFFSFVLPVFIPVYFFNQDLKWAIISQIFMRYPWGMNVMWSVNSFAHMFGDRTYDKSIKPSENIFVRIITGCEGWHNYHHAFPWDYRPSELNPFFFNSTSILIRLWEKMGLAYDLKTASVDHVRKVVEAKGDGTHPIYGNKEHIEK